MTHDRSEGIVIQTRDLTMTYPGAAEPAVNHLTISIEKGEIFGLLGPNGAGKTTAISIMSTLLKPDSGSISMYGIDVVRNPAQIKKLIGYVPQEVALYTAMSARENLRFIGRIFGMRGKALEERIAECMDFVGLEAGMDQRVGMYSGGMKRRANLAAGILHNPRILFLDEPTVGVDPQSRNLILERISSLRATTTIVYTTHYMEEAEMLCRRVAIMDRGRIITEGAPDDLVRSVPGCANLEELFIKLTGKQLRD
jgi:ABC-2 type transport system ATP-binding protein